MIPPNTAQDIVVTATVSGILTVLPRHLLAEQQLMLAARGVVDVLPNHAFHVPVNNFLTSHDNLTKRMAIAYIDELPTSTYENWKDSQKIPPQQTLKEQCKPRTKLQILNYCSENNTRDTVSTVSDKLNVYRAIQMAQHSEDLHDEAQRLAYYKCDRVDLSDRSGYDSSP